MSGLLLLPLLAMVMLPAQSLISLRGEGGGRIRIRGRWYQFTRGEIARIYRSMTPGEQLAVLAVAIKQERQRCALTGAVTAPSGEEQAEAEMAWEQAALRWLRRHSRRAASLGLAPSLV